MSSIAVAADTVAVPRADRFYVRMAVVCAGVAFLGFAPTYWACCAARWMSHRWRICTR
jgi:hypothetical protein